MTPHAPDRTKVGCVQPGRCYESHIESTGNRPVDVPCAPIERLAMSDPLQAQIDRLRRMNRLYGAVILVLMAAVGRELLVGADRSFQTLDVERINVLNESGLPALVLAGQGNLPGPTFEGTEYAQELSGGRVTGSGVIFFNERGDEVGGLVYHGNLADEGYTASGGITFDQFRQDQVVSVQYGDDGTSRSAGLNVWDRSTEIGIAELLDLVEARRTGSPAVQDSVNQIIQEMVAQGLSAHRLFVGSRNRTASLRISDTQGRPRIRLFVDSLDVARLEFLDESGAVLLSLPE